MGRPRAALATALGAALGACLVPGTPATAATAASSGSGPSLTLVSQTPWVGPGQAMQLHLGLGRADLSGLTLGVTVFQHLTNRSAFAETVAGNAVGGILVSETIGADTLPTDPQGGADLTLAVESGDTGATVSGSGAGGGAGQVTVNLRCAANSCGGVYPVRLQLSSAGGGPRTQLFTYLVYDNPPADTQKLRFALVVPVAAPAPTPGASGQEPLLANADVDRLNALISAISTRDTPVTLEPEPATVTSLQSSGRARARAALNGLVSLSGGTGRLTLAQGFVPVDPSALVSAGLAGELGEQVRRAAQVLAPLHPSSGTWVATGTLDQAALGALGQLGYRHLVVPATAVAGGSGSGLTPSRPFTLGSGRDAPLVVESDPALSAHLAGASGPSSALAAYQLLADLALVYYEQPNLLSARGVVAVPPAGWAPDPTFLSTVLSALPADPVVSPVNLTALFSDVAPATGPARRPASVTSTSQLPARQIRDQRNRLSGFASAVGASGLTEVHALDDLLLRSQDTRLRPAEQRAWVGSSDSALSSQLSLLSIRTDTVRLTSSAAKVPVTLLKQSPWVVSGRLEIVGDKVVFPGADQQAPGTVCRDPSVQASAGRSRFACTATITHPTNAVYVAMRARATGDFRLTVTLVSPTGGIVLASSHLTVRSMSTSLVAIALSLAAIAVLLLWWGRTLWRGRRPRRGAHVRGAASRTP